jgi:outer membrane protein TolC
MKHSYIISSYNALKTTLWLVLVLWWGPEGISQVTLQEFMNSARAFAPSLSIKQLADERAQFQMSNESKRWLPQLDVRGQITYQSETTSLNLDFPGVDIDPLSGDQYQMVTEGSQLLYDGGRIEVSRNLHENAAEIENAKAETSLKNTRKLVIHLFFAILEIDANLDILDTKSSSIEATLSLLEAGLEEGVILRSELQTLSAELLKVQQQKISLNKSREILFGRLSTITGLSLPPTTELAIPADPTMATAASDPILPVMEQFRLESERIDLSMKALAAQRRPTVQAFTQLGYGKPGLNFLENQFNGFYIMGIRAGWKLGGYYTRVNDSEIQKINQSLISEHITAYNREIESALIEAKTKATELEALLETDRTLSALTSDIRKTAENQFIEGVITSSNYIGYLNEETAASLTSQLHRIQLTRQNYLIQHIEGTYASQ